ncbi:MAG TPA: LamG-like jellyroll fold domain-containing protein, partial [Christiangramia sp.]|nr:LamG-like jellyroll fold domain-containing protein [Christiangramia sp.]
SDANGEYTSILKISDPELDDSGVYWVEVNGPDYFTCSEGTSNSFSFSVKEADGPPTAEDVIYCLNDDAVALTATVNGDNLIKWYDADYNELGDTVIPPTNEAKTITYYVTQTKEYSTSNGYVVGCESDYTKVTVKILEKPEPISPEALEFEYCFGEEANEAISINPADGATINWYDSVDATSTIAPPIPNTSTAAVTTYYISQTFSYEGPVFCESDRTEVIVRVKDLPTVNVDITGSESTICLGSTVTLSATGAESYIWSEGEAELGTTANIDITPNTIGEHSYTVVGTTNGCTNSYDVTINVDDNSVAGTLDAPERICISGGSATLELTGTTGDIIRWEYKSASTSDTWTDVGDGNLAAERTFNNLTEDTSFRVTVQNGVCSEDTVEATIIIDELPLGGEALWSKNNERLFLTCVNPVSGYASSLELIGYVGEIAGWEYRGTSASSWTTINTTDPVLTPSQIEGAVSPGDETTVFRALLTNNSCTEGVYSETALVSVIQAEIKPTPVEVDKDVICIGETISLSSQTGYSTTGEKFEGGQFTEAGIKNKGWRFTNPSGGSNDYDAAANNGRADHWLKMNASGGEDGKVYTGTLPDYATASTIRWTSELNVNEKFALVTGDNVSLMETPVFSLNGMDEAIFTWDQGYNLSAGATITVEISTNGGANYNTVLYTLTSDGTEEIGSSGNYLDFGGGTHQSRPKNKMEIDLGDYIGQSNLRVRFNYEGVRDGDVWAVDNIKVPEGPQDILLQWYYDEDLEDETNTLEEIGEVNQNTVSFIPRKIGWNDFEVQTRIILDSNGDQCQSIDNFERIRVWAFDEYTTTTEAIIGTCGSSSVTLNASVYATTQAKNITEYPTLDGYVGSWKVSDLNGNEVTTGFTFTNQDDTSVLEPINDPNAIFEADDLGSYRFEWILTPTAVDENDILIDNSGCPPIVNNNEVTLIECTTLDFDGVDDYVDLDNNYTGNYFIEAWIRPFARPLPEGGNTNPNTGSIISGAGFDISMDKISAYFTADDKWHHIAVSNNGQLYIDGIDRGSITITSSGSNRTLIGARWNTTAKTTENHFSGWIEEVRIWNTAPTPKQLRFMMNQRLKLDASGTVVNPLQGETVPNLFIDNLSSYHTDGTHNLDAENV